ncbi:MAG: hypothetical protein K0S45_3667 [Nitrospira sp.]|jgi:hypothetical protein|nr:hypothetical protein [Nitrospira sp.]
MSQQTHFHYKGYRAQVWATERPDGGWVPHGKVTRRVGERDLVHATAGHSSRTLPTKAEAETIAKVTVQKYIDEQGA